MSIGASAALVVAGVILILFSAILAAISTRDGMFWTAMSFYALGATATVVGLVNLLILAALRA